MRTAREIWASRNPQHECGNDGKDLFYKTMEICMQEYAVEYHQSELLKLNKSDVISSVCNHKWKLMRNTHYLYRCTKCGMPNEMQTKL